MEGPKRGVLVVATIVVLLAVLLIGNVVYWVADGRPGTPAEFRSRVSEAGLDVDWSNNGPVAGDGVVQTECGPVVVTVGDIEGELWLRWDGRRARLDPEAIENLLECRR